MVVYNKLTQNKQARKDPGFLVRIETSHTLTWRALAIVGKKN